MLVSVITRNQLSGMLGATGLPGDMQPGCFLNLTCNMGIKKVTDTCNIGISYKQQATFGYTKSTGDKGNPCQGPHMS